jgi:hypothetical protein
MLDFARQTAPRSTIEAVGRLAATDQRVGSARAGKNFPWQQLSDLK